MLNVPLIKREWLDSKEINNFNEISMKHKVKNIKTNNLNLKNDCKNSKRTQETQKKNDVVTNSNNDYKNFKDIGEFETNGNDIKKLKHYINSLYIDQEKKKE
ncbi:MAG: hypothetical protein ACFFBF_09585 [Promethearchaeota archaeon]